MARKKLKDALQKKQQQLIGQDSAEQLQQSLPQEEQTVVNNQSDNSSVQVEQPNKQVGLGNLEQEVERLNREKKELDDLVKFYEHKLKEIAQKNVKLQQEVSDLNDLNFTGENNEAIDELDAIRIVTVKTEQKLKLDMQITELQNKYGIKISPTPTDNPAWEKAPPATDNVAQFGLSSSLSDFAKISKDESTLNADSSAEMKPAEECKTKNIY